MTKLRILIKTTLVGPTIRDGKYVALVEYVGKSGPVTRTIFGSEEQTTYHRSVLLAMVKALAILTKPCEVEILTDCIFVANMVKNNNPDKWRRAEWKRPSGDDVANKELWKEFMDEMDRHEIAVSFCNHHDYSSFLSDFLQKS